MNIEFKHAIGDTITIKIVDIKGQITALRHDDQGNWYLVVWWCSGDRKCEWLAEWEIK